LKAAITGIALAAASPALAGPTYLVWDLYTKLHQPRKK